MSSKSRKKPAKNLLKRAGIDADPQPSVPIIQRLNGSVHARVDRQVIDFLNGHNVDISSLIRDALHRAASKLSKLRK